MKKKIAFALFIATLFACNNKPITLHDKMLGSWRGPQEKEVTFEIKEKTFFYPESPIYYNYWFISDNEIQMTWEGGGGDTSQYRISVVGDSLMMYNIQEQENSLFLRMKE